LTFWGGGNSNQRMQLYFFLWIFYEITISVIIFLQYTNSRLDTMLPPFFWLFVMYCFLNFQIVNLVKKKCPEVPIVLYINGNGGLLERMKDTGVDVIGLDWTVDMADGRRRLGSGIGVQGNVDPAYLFSPLNALTEEIQRLVT